MDGVQKNFNFFGLFLMNLGITGQYIYRFWKKFRENFREFALQNSAKI